MNRAIVAAALSAISVDAYAQDFRIGGELGLFHQDFGLASGTVLTEVIDADIVLVDTVALVAELPLLQIFSSAESAGTEARFRIGNPHFAAYYHSQGDILKLRIGGGVAVPAAQLPDDEFSGAAASYGFATAMYGLLRPWLWQPEALPIQVPSLRIGADISIVTIEASGDIVIMVPINDGQDVEVLVPLSAGAMVHLWFLGLGGSIGAAFLPTAGEGADRLQVSLSPRITATFGPVELEARLTMNLDEPFGFAFDDGGIWGFFLGVHAQF
jgi:hypothetical protein